MYSARAAGVAPAKENTNIRTSMALKSILAVLFMVITSRVIDIQIYVNVTYGRHKLKLVIFFYRIVTFFNCIITNAPVKCKRELKNNLLRLHNIFRL